MNDELLSIEAVEIEAVDFDEPPVTTAARDWAEPNGPRSLLPWALAGTALLLIWRFVGVRLFVDGAPNAEWLPLIVGGALPMLFIVAYPIIAIRRSGGKVFAERLTLPTVLMEGAIAVGVLACVYAVNIAVALIYTRLSGDKPGMPEQMEELALSGNPWALLFLGLMACLWAPFAEELFFRRLLLRALAARWPIAAAVGVQAFLFAVMHDYRGMHLIAIFVLGIALGGLYVWRRNIITPMLLHMFQNTGATVIMGAIMLLLQFAPVLGVSGETSDAGCLVTLVDPGTAADEAGLRAGDVIVSADGMRTPDFTTLRLLLMFKRPGQELQLEVLRDGETLKLTPLLQERDDAAEPDAPPQRAGEQ